MWRNNEERAASAGERLALAAEVWHWKPHPSQERFFSCPAQVKVAACGRRWGKTEALSVDVASLALAEAAAGRDCRQLVVAPTDAQARLLGDAAAGRLRAAFDAGAACTRGLALDIRQRPGLQVTVYPAGTDPRAAADGKARRADGKARRADGPGVARILCRTAARDGAGLRGLWAHRIIVDEAGRVPDAVMTDVLMPMLMDVGGDYVLASSPFGRRSAFYRLFARGAPCPPSSGTLSTGAPEGPPEDREEGRGRGVASASREGELGAGKGETEKEGVTFASFRCPTGDNPYNDGAFLLSMRDEMGDAMYAQEILAEFSDDGGAVFREDDIVGCLARDGRVTAARGELRSEPRPGRFYSVGIDWGRKMDYTVVCVLDATELPARLVSLQRWTATGWEKQLADVAETIARFAPLRVLADGNSIGDPLAETLTGAVRAAQVRLGMHDPRGVTVERFVFTADSKLQLVDRLNLGLSRRGLTYPNHRALLGELRGFEYGPSGSSGRARMAARGSGHDDIVMGLALAWWCAPEGAPEAPASRVLLGSSLRR